jgi:Ni/Co efflux regulator RcnB
MIRLPSVLAAVALAIAPCLGAVLTAQPCAAQTRHHWKRGDTLPPEVLRAGPDTNYAAQRLRRPPDGYGWFAVDGEYLLASLSSGLILETVE